MLSNAHKLKNVLYKTPRGKLFTGLHSFFIYREHVLKKKTLGIPFFQREHFTLTIFMENQNKEHIAI